ncbi:hypothetical protein [Enterovirga sp. CN4-39]|uniref:hypothetical protein n=1 Tax=Enterovirga sp. CN4-39 TaxID=3400910 RepID=UPI003C082716
MIQLSPTALKQAGFGFNRYDVLIPKGVPFSALLVPEFWTNVGMRLRRFDVVRAVADDGAFDAELTVANDPAPKPGFASLPNVQMRLLRYWDPSMEDTQAIGEIAGDTEVGFRAEWGGPNHKYRVIDPNGGVIAKGMTSQAEADAWLAAHLDQRAGRQAA